MSGGFEYKPKLYQLVWDRGDYEGLEVTINGVATGPFLEIQEMAEQLSDTPKAGELRPVLRRFGNLLVEWNIKIAGKPLPAVYASCVTSGKPQLRADPAHCEEHKDSDEACEFEGLVSLDLDLAMDIFARWSKAVGGVDPTSPNGSSGGETSAEGQPPGLASASHSLSP